MPSLARILIADDWDELRSALRNVLETQPRYSVCGKAASGAEAVAKVTPKIRDCSRAASLCIWAWESIRPGSSVFPVPFMIFADGLVTSGPISFILPSSISTLVMGLFPCRQRLGRVGRGSEWIGTLPVGCTRETSAIAGWSSSFSLRELDNPKLRGSQTY